MAENCTLASEMSLISVGYIYSILCALASGKQPCQMRRGLCTHYLQPPDSIERNGHFTLQNIGVAILRYPFLLFL